MDAVTRAHSRNWTATTPRSRFGLRADRSFTNTNTDVHGKRSGSANVRRHCYPMFETRCWLTGFLNVFGHVAFSAAQYDHALQLVDRLVNEANAAGLTFPLSHGLATRANALVGLRRLLEARRVLRDIERLTPMIPHVAGNAVLCAAKLRIALGDVERAAAILDADPPKGLNPPFVAELFGYRGLVHASLGSFGKAMAAFVEADKSHYVDATATALLGRAIVALGRRRSWGRGARRHAVKTVIGTGCREVLVAAMRAYPPLVSVCAEDPWTVKQLTPLLVASRDVALGRRSGFTMPREVTRGGRLSAREHEVSELLAQGCSNPEIARALFY